MKSFLSEFIFVAAVALVLQGCNKDDIIIDPNQPADDAFRPATTESSPLSDAVYQYTPAPGQFINEAGAEFSTAEDAAAWAENRLKTNKTVSLGAFGGFIVVGFDHSVLAGGGDYDFAVAGNAFYNAGSTTGGSNEAGVVYVMKDSNANGLPDDTWYMLMGSETNYDPDYAVTYFKPDGDGQDVPWTDNRGNSGVVKYLPFFHSQPTYYPAWINSPSYTLAGVCLNARNELDLATGYWNNNPYASGYADNMGADSAELGEYRQCNRFRIADAVDATGAPANLQFIDFVKVQTAVNTTSGALGEISTEVLGVIDLNLWDQ